MILNKDKIRPDVLKNGQETQKILTRGIFKYLRKNPNIGIDFEKLWARVMKANVQFFKKEKTAAELTAELTEKEKQALANILRFSFEFLGTVNQKKNPILENVEIEEVNLDGVPAEWQLVPNAQKDKVILYFHGGGYVMGSPKTHRLLTVSLARVTNMKVLSVDYRLGPEHRYPEPMEDAITAYKWLLNQGIESENIIISGDSAGGHLTLITLLKLKEESIDLPAGAVPISPLTLATLEGETFFSNAETDPVLADIGLYWWIGSAVEGLDAADPSFSPALADMSGLPPLCFQCSSTEMLYGDSVAAVEKAKNDGVDADLQAWADMTHVFQMGGSSLYPESEEAFAKFAEFAKKVIKS